MLLIVVASGAYALTLEKLVTKATFECIGVRVSYSGDAVSIRYREKGAAEWRDGHPLIRIKGDRFVTSLFWLKEGTTYEIELAPSGPEGPQPLEVTTRSSVFPAPGRELIVDAGAGPFRTIQAAANAAQPGDTVRIRPGTYREEVRPPRSGTPDAYIRFIGDGPGVILDGGETIPADSGWTALGDGVYSRPYAGSPRYASLDGVRLYRHSSAENLRSRGDGIEGGFFVEQGTLYVKAPDGQALAGRTLRAAALGYGFYLDGRAYIEIRNVEIHHYDTMGVRFRDTHHAALRDSVVHDSRQMVYVDRVLSTDNLIEGNRLWGSGVPDWPWAICHHDHDCSSNGVYVSAAGEGNVVRRNQVSGLFNGIYVGGWVPDYPEEWALENDVYENLIELIKDDAIEPECQAINLRIFGNVMRSVFVGISLAPIETGPTWVLYNLIYRARGHEMGGGQWVKISTTPTGAIPMGEVRIYHNTAYYDEPEHNGWSSTGSGNTHFINNIVACTRYVFENSSSAPYPPGNVWDYNNFYTTDPTRYIKFENQRLNLAGFLALGFQRNGISATPRFRDPAAGDFRLLPDDPGIDKGLPLPGINDGYWGPAPDIGAFEHAPPPPGGN
ncbi:MAG: right-handed parallel beta-helix repeat-containing protein [Acidobacteriota bacterium]